MSAIKHVFRHFSPNYSPRGILITQRRELPYALMLKLLRREQAYIGCMTDADLIRCYYNGSGADRAKRAPVDPTWLSDNRLKPTPTKLLADQYCNAIKDYIAGRIDWEDMNRITGYRNLGG